MLKKLTVKKRIIFLYIGIILFSSFLVFIFLIINRKSDEIDDWIARQEMYAITLSHGIQDEFDKVENYFQLILDTKEFRTIQYADMIDTSINGIPKEYEKNKRSVFDHIIENSDYISAVYMLIPNGDFYIIQPYLTQLDVNISNLSHREYFKKAKETKSLVISNSFYGADGILGLSIFTPILDNDENIICYIGAFFHLEDISLLVDENNINQYDLGMVFDRKGQLIAHTEEKLLEKIKPMYNNILNQFNDRFYDEIHEKDFGSDTFMVRNLLYKDPYYNKNMLGSIVYLESGLNVVLSIEMKTINDESLYKSLIYSSVIAVFFIIAGLPGLIYLLTLYGKWIKAEDELKSYTKNLEIANNELESFSYSVSHDLRAPLRAIDGFSLAIIEDYKDKLDDVGKEYLERIRYNTIRMGQLIDDLLKLSRVTRYNLEKTEIDISKISRDITERLKKQKPDRDININIQSGLYAYGDYNLIKIVMENLIGNAWKFTRKQSHAIIEIGKLNHNEETVDEETVDEETVDEERQIFYIKDNGAGFDSDHAQRLFGAFQRFHEKEDFEGSGIGLATVKRIISRHNGKIWAESRKGDGATFYLEL
jgi:signal transduction histidine kinase